MKPEFDCNDDADGGLVPAVHPGGSPREPISACVDVELIRCMVAMAHDGLTAITELERVRGVDNDVQSMLVSKYGFRSEMAERLARAFEDAIAGYGRALRADVEELDDVLQSANGPDGEILLRLNSKSPDGRYLIFGNHYLLDTAAPRIYPIGANKWLVLNGKARIENVKWLSGEGGLVAFRLTWPRRSVHVLFDLASWRAIEVEQNRFEALTSGQPNTKDSARR